MSRLAFSVSRLIYADNAALKEIAHATAPINYTLPGSCCNWSQRTVGRSTLVFVRSLWSNENGVPTHDVAVQIGETTELARLHGRRADPEAMARFEIGGAEHCSDNSANMVHGRVGDWLIASFPAIPGASENEAVFKVASASANPDEFRRLKYLAESHVRADGMGALLQVARRIRANPVLESQPSNPQPHRIRASTPSSYYANDTYAKFVEEIRDRLRKERIG